MNAGPQGKRWHWYDVPAGTPVRECRDCKAPIYWITTAKGKKCPIDCDTVDGSTPPSTTGDGIRLQTQWNGVGVSHFQTCTNPQPFSGRNRR